MLGRLNDALGAHFRISSPYGEEVTGLAVQHRAQRAQRAEPHRPGPPVLEHRQVGERDAHPVGEVGQRHAPLGQQLVDVHLHPVLVLRRHQITASSSARIATPR